MAVRSEGSADQVQEVRERLPSNRRRDWLFLTRALESYIQHVQLRKWKTEEQESQWNCAHTIVASGMASWDDNGELWG